MFVVLAMLILLEPTLPAQLCAWTRLTRGQVRAQKSGACVFLTCSRTSAAVLTQGEVTWAEVAWTVQDCTCMSTCGQVMK